MDSSTARLSSVLLALGLAAISAGCTTPRSWAMVVVDRPFGEIWDGFVEIAERQGYAADLQETDRGLRKYTSRWREAPAPFGMGSRSRLVARFERPEPGPDGEVLEGWMLEFHVQRQVVKNMSPGFDPQERDWSDSGQDRTREDVLYGQIRLRFGHELGVSPTYRQSK
jgi:hypothetical protein